MDDIRVLEHKNAEKADKPSLYQYNESGLDNVWLFGGFSLEVVDGEEFLFVDDQEELHKAIALGIVRNGSRITGRELRFLRHELNLTQWDLARLLESDPQAVARWEKGKSRIPGPADRLIRFLYLERMHENPDVCELLETLAELDRLTHDKAVFERVQSRWQKQAA
jgi:DNA-binding transcriptional regulator YiaG